MKQNLQASGGRGNRGEDIQGGAEEGSDVLLVVARLELPEGGGYLEINSQELTLAQAVANFRALR